MIRYAAQCEFNGMFYTRIKYKGQTIGYVFDKEPRGFGAKRELDGPDANLTFPTRQQATRWLSAIHG